MMRQRPHHRFLLEYLRHLNILRCYHQTWVMSGVQLMRHRLSDKPAGVETYLSKLLQDKTITKYLLVKLT